MLSQEKLNSVDLKTASDMISDTLINERLSLKKKRAQLEELKAKYQDDYIAANDGDARENAPLEAAIENLKNTTGDIVAVTKKYQSLDAVEDLRYLNATYDYDTFVESVGALSENSRTVLFGVMQVSDIEQCVKKMQESEFDFVDEVVRKYDEFYGTTVANNMLVDYPKDHPIWKSRSAVEATVLQRRSEGEMAAEYRVIMELGKIRTMKSMPPYNHCGLIVMYTTVRLRMNSNLYTYRIYPKGLSFIDDGVMAANSRLATALMGKRVGDKVTIRHGSRDTMLVYEIIDIY